MCATHSTPKRLVVEAYRPHEFPAPPSKLRLIGRGTAGHPADLGLFDYSQVIHPKNTYTKTCSLTLNPKPETFNRNPETRVQVTMQLVQLDSLDKGSMKLCFTAPHYSAWPGEFVPGLGMLDIVAVESMW